MPAGYHLAAGPARRLRAYRGAELWSLRSFSGVRAHGCCCTTRDSCSPQASRAERAQLVRAGMARAQDGCRGGTTRASQPDLRHCSARSATTKQLEIWGCRPVNMSRHGDARQYREVGASLVSEVAGNAVPGNANRTNRSVATVLLAPERSRWSDHLPESRSSHARREPWLGRCSSRRTSLSGTDNQ